MGVQDRLDDLIKDVNRAYVKRESRLVMEHLQSRGATFFAASATSYLEWRDRMRRRDPSLDPEASGIPAIIRHFLSVPASTNLSKYHDHVHRVLPAFRARCGRVLKKHTEDQHYAKMRKAFAAQIPTLISQLEQAVPGTVEQAILLPWSEHDESKITEGIETLFTKNWVHPEIYVWGFDKMLRENGIPVDGVYAERDCNLNEDILGTLGSRIDDWAEGMTDSAETIAQAMYKPVECILETVQMDLQTCTATPELMEAATEALEETSEEIEMAYNTLLIQLQHSLEDTQLRFTTEIDIECPIAQTMKSSYERASDRKFAWAGKGLYIRLRKVLRESMLNPKKYYTKFARGEEHIKPFLSTLKEKVVNRQNEVWKEDCMTFIIDTTKLLEKFSKTTEDLLMDAAFMKEDHRKARELLKSLLGSFDEKLEEVQNEFVNVEPQHRAKKVKVENQEETHESLPATPLVIASEAMAETLPEIVAEPEPSTEPTLEPPSDSQDPTYSAPISQNMGWHHFLANMYPLRSD
jgi:hypothetical protein